MNKCLVKKRFVCGVGHDRCSTCWHDYDCDKSGLVKGDSAPCPYRSLKIDGVYDCTCPSAIMEVSNGKDK